MRLTSGLSVLAVLSLSGCSQSDNAPPKDQSAVPELALQLGLE